MKEDQRWMWLAFVLLMAVLGLGTMERGEAEVRPDTLASSDSSHAGVSDAGEDSYRQPDYVLKPWRALRSHLHNKVIHIPIGFALSAFVLSVLALKKPELQWAIRWLVLIAAAGSLATLLTGLNQATVYEGSYKEWVVDLHEDLGMATVASVWIWCLALWVRSLTRWAFVAGVLAVALVTIAGFFGGIIAHG